MTHPDEQDGFCTLSGGRRLCYRTGGDPAGAPLVLIAGLGLDLTSWPQAMTGPLARAGFHLVFPDNRDAGRSFRADAPPPGLLRQLLARPRKDAYDLADMAHDTVQLLDHLEVDRAHLVGMSMGGMIAQTVAARHPDRVASLTSIFSTTGDRGVGQPAASTLLRMAKPRARTREQAVLRHLALVRHIAGTGWPVDAEAESAYAARAWDRGDGPAHRAVARQIGAIQASGDRTAEVRRITAPTLVIHGDSDRMVHPSGGRATADAVPGARHVTVTGMGHYLAPGVAGRLADLITDHARAADPAGQRPPAPGGTR